MTNKKEKPIRYILVALCGLLTLGNVIKFSITGQWARLLLALLTLVLILIPEGIERLFHCHISQGMYLTAVLYATGPMLGHCNNLYYILPFWDKMLHILGGVMFVFLGIFLFALLGGDQKSWALCCLFALCFSLAVSVLWEFYEFGSDRLFGTDTQDDCIIHSITSHMLSPEMGEVGRFTGIQQVTLNGHPLDLGGYLDIGLIDTMMDMLLESLGAAVTAVILWADKNRHPVFQRRETVPADCLSPLDGCSHQTGWHRFLCKFCRMERDGPICLV